MLIHGVSEDGQNLAVLRARDGQLEAGVVRPAKAGQPIAGELVRLTPRADAPFVCDVAVEYAPPAEAKLSHGGPAQVATRSYRQNWDAIWSDSRKKSAPN